MTTKNKQQLEEQAPVSPKYPVHGDYRRALDAWMEGTPEYQEAEEDLKRLAQHNPRLYSKIVNWD